MKDCIFLLRLAFNIIKIVCTHCDIYFHKAHLKNIYLKSIYFNIQIKHDYMIF